MLVQWVYSWRMRIGLSIIVALFALLCLSNSAFAQAMPGDMSVTAGGINPGPDIKTGGLPLVEQTQDPANGLTDETRRKLAVWTAGLSFLVGIGFFFMKQFDWQRLAGHQTCLHCLTIHNGLGSFAFVSDLSSISALFYLALLLIGAALNEGPISAEQIGISILLFLAFGIGITGMGAAARMAFTVRRQKAQSNANWMAAFLSGCRIIGLGLGGAILARGITPEASANQLEYLVGSQLGEHLIASVGIGPIRDTAIVLVGSILTSGSVRWVLPFVFGSRPLVFLSDHHRSHSAFLTART